VVTVTTGTIVIESDAEAVAAVPAVESLT